MWGPVPGTCWLFTGIVACGCWSISDSFAQNYPVKPIRIFVGTSAGGGSDTTARAIAQKISESFGQAVVVENRTGAAGWLAIERVATSSPDGYTLLLLASSAAVQPALNTNLRYDLVRDFMPVSLVTMTSAVLVIHPSLPVRTVKELIALARAQPDKLSYGSTGVGGTTHLMGELFNFMAKVKIVHVPYKGGADIVIPIASGQIEMSFPGLVASMPLVRANKLRALAVTSAKRSVLEPSIPTIDESGLSGYNRTAWNGVCAPAGVPKDIIARLNAVIVKAVGTSEMQESFHRQGLETQTNTPEQFAAFIQGEIAQNTKLAKLIGLKPE